MFSFLNCPHLLIYFSSFHVSYSLMDYSYSASQDLAAGVGHSSAHRSSSRTRASSRSRSPPGSRASVGDAHARSHANQRHSSTHGSQYHQNENHQEYQQQYQQELHASGGSRHHSPASLHGRNHDASSHREHQAGDNFSVHSSGGTSKRHRDSHDRDRDRDRDHSGGGDKSNFVKRNQMKPDKRMSERGLEDQIVELSQFLEHDSERFQSQQVRSRMRVSAGSATKSNR